MILMIGEESRSKWSINPRSIYGRLDSIARTNMTRVMIFKISIYIYVS